MATDIEVAERPIPKEIIFNEYGLYLVTHRDAYPLTNTEDSGLNNSENVVLVSQPDWNQTLQVLENGNFGRTTVLTPELITVAGLPFANLLSHEADIKRALEEVSVISSQQPEATFIIGSPQFIPGESRPFNAAIVFKEGKITQSAHKRLLKGDEADNFVFIPEDSPTAIGDASLIICRDLIGAQQTRTTHGNRMEWYTEKMTGDSGLAKRFKDAEFIAPGTNRILMTSCWAVGPSVWSDTDEAVIDQHYLANLRVAVRVILTFDPNINQVIICDRSPLNRYPGDGTKPMSGVFFKQ